MVKPVVVLLSRRGRDSIPEDQWRVLAANCRLRAVRCQQPPGEDEAVRLLGEADLLAATNACLPRLNAGLLGRLPRLRGVVLYATGYDHLDVPLLQAHGVGLSVLPDYATEAVAEHGLALLLALATRLHLASDRSRCRADPAVSLRGVELRGRTLGIVGVGRIGTRLAELAVGLGMSVLGHDCDDGAVRRAAARGIPMLPLTDLLQASSAVAVCASHSFAGPAVLAAEQLHRMRPGALLVNVGRPALVDTAAAVDALRAGRLRGYAVDDTVLDPVRDADLLDQGRVLQTGHSAWWRDEVLQRGARDWGEHLVAAVAGRPRHAVTWPRQVDLTVSGGEPATSRARGASPEPAPTPEPTVA